MQKGEHLRILREMEVFSGLGDDELDSLEARFSPITFPGHTLVYRHGDAAEHFYVILEGQVALYRDEVGRPVRLQQRLGPGEYFGESGLFDGRGRSSSARTSETTRLLRISTEDLASFLGDRPAVAIRIQVSAARRHTQNVATALDLGHRSEVRIRLDRQVALESPFGRPISVVLDNLSLGGLCLDGAPASWQQGRQVSFSLGYAGQSLPIEGRVSWREASKVGISFTISGGEHEERVQRMLRKLLE